jgi:hypothetical protein
MDESRSQFRFYCIGKRSIYLRHRLAQVAGNELAFSEFAEFEAHQFDAANR